MRLNYRELIGSVSLSGSDSKTSRELKEIRIALYMLASEIQTKSELRIKLELGDEADEVAHTLIGKVSDITTSIGHLYEELQEIKEVQRGRC